MVEVSKWIDYLDHYLNAEEVEVTSEMKERLSEKPIFLQRYC